MGPSDLPPSLQPGRCLPSEHTRLRVPFHPPHTLLPKSSFVCTRFVITHPGHKTYRILNWTEVPNALKEFMLHNCTGLPENKQWCMARILSRGDDSDLSLWLRPCLAADGATCNLSSRCTLREDKQKSNVQSRGHRWENTSYLELLETLNAFIRSESRLLRRLWKRKPDPIGIMQQPTLADVCPVKSLMPGHPSPRAPGLLHLRHGCAMFVPHHQLVWGLLSLLSLQTSSHTLFSVIVVYTTPNKTL